MSVPIPDDGAGAPMSARATGPLTFDAGARGPWVGLLAGLGVLGGLEALVLHLFAAALLPGPVAVAVDVVVGVLTAAVLLAFASPLWSRHSVSPDVVRLRLGWVGGVTVPRDALDGVAEHATSTGPVDLGAGHDAATGRLSLVRAPSSPLVLVTLARPVPARVQLVRRVEASSVLVSTSDPAALVAALSAR